MTTAETPPAPTPVYRPLPVDPELKRRHYSDGLLQVPLDLVRDPKLGPGDVRVGCALSALCFGSTEVIELNTTIGRCCRLSPREVQQGLNRLETAGWILRATAPGTKHRRRIVLLWKLPDDFRDAVHPVALPRSKRPALRVVGELPLLDRAGGDS